MRTAQRLKLPPITACKTFSGSVALFALGALFSLAVAYGQSSEAQSKWDMKLPQLELQNVHVRGSSLNNSWQRMSAPFGVRTVLFWPEGQPWDFNFEFDREACNVTDLLAAFCGTYPGYVFTQDKKTGVIWLHPKSFEYENILAAKVRVQRHAQAVPMLTGILEHLRTLETLGVRIAGKGGTSVTGTFDYPVDLSPGVYSVRDILNVCCAANPNRTFQVTLRPQGSFAEILPLTVSSATVSNSTRQPLRTPGALAFWRSEIDDSVQGFPTEGQLIDALASENARIRSKARNFLGIGLSTASVDVDNLATRAASTDKAVWTDLASLIVLVRGELDGPIRIAPSERLQKQLHDGDWAGRQGLKTLVATELARVMKDATFLEQDANRPLAATETAQVKPDLIRALRSSKFLRNKLLELNPQWAGFSKAEIEEFGRQDIFSLP